MIKNSKNQYLRGQIIGDQNKFLLGWETLDKNNAKSFVWSLIPTDPKTDFPVFKIEMSGLSGRNPRLLVKKCIRNTFKVFMSTSDAEGYSNSDMNEWKVIAIED